MAERTSRREFFAWAVRTAGEGAVLTSVMTACGGGEKTGKADVPPTAAATLIPESTVVPTPEKPILTFAHYDVFSADYEGGGKIMFAAISDSINPKKGKLIVFSGRENPTCDVGAPLLFYAAPNYDSGEINSQLPLGRVLKLSLKEDGLVSGSISYTKYGSCDGQILSFSGKREGNGEKSLLSAFRTARGSAPGINNITDQQIKDGIRQYTNVILP